MADEISEPDDEQASVGEDAIVDAEPVDLEAQHNVPPAQHNLPPAHRNLPETANAIVDDSYACVSSVQWIAVLVWTVIADLAIFRTHGFSGLAVFFAVAIPVIVIGTLKRQHDRSLWVCLSLLAFVACKLAWNGSPLAIIAGISLTLASGVAAAGYLPLVLETFIYGLRITGDGIAALFKTRPQSLVSEAVAGTQDPAAPDHPRRSGGKLVSVLMPVLATGIFAVIFVLANPDLVELVSLKLRFFSDAFWQFCEKISFWELPFCAVAMLVGLGLLRPLIPGLRIGPDTDPVRASMKGFESSLYAAYRNTLVMLSLLFAVYLGFEFMTLWRRDFPDNFYYAGYAHQGAAWLTIALALATLMLSWIFSGETLLDARSARLKRWAWLWSAMNFLLAIAVYNRLIVYVSYNGMTQLRTVGFFGITLVVVGLCLVIYKIKTSRGFWWLIRAQLIAFALVVVIYSLFPVDYVAHRYNAHRVASGYLHPSVMIAVKPIDDAGILALVGTSEQFGADEIVQQGTLALLAQRQIEIEDASRDGKWHWTRFQGSTERAYRALKANEARWKHYLVNPSLRGNTISRFQSHAMQWY